MQLECTVRLVAILVRNSFKRPVRSNLYLGIKPRDPLEPVLVLVTSSIILEFRVTCNVKRVYKKEVDQGRVGIEFYSPPHQLLVSANKRELPDFLDLFYKLMDRKVMERLEFIPILRQFSRPNKNTMSDTVTCRICTSSEYEEIRKKSKYQKVPVNLQERISHHLREVDLPDCHLKDIPAALGGISVERINLENNELTDENLLWLEELPIRKSLKSLNLAENKINVFPSVLIDFQSLVSLNFRDNSIEVIPGGINQLRCLKYLNLSGNNLRYLPANFKSLKLSEVDLTYNYLTSNVRGKFQPKLRYSSRNCLRLWDLAAMQVDPNIRRELTTRLYPRSLLDSLRQLSKCVCDRQTIPHFSSQLYEMLYRIGFALTYNIHPQKNDFLDTPLHGYLHKGNGIGNIFLQFHLCSKCEDEYFQYLSRSPYCCYRLDQNESN